MPWIFSVAASSIDRKIINNIVLGNGKILTLFNIIREMMLIRLQGVEQISLLYSDASSSEERNARFCTQNCLGRKLVKDKVVICESEDFSGGAWHEAFRAGAMGAILLGNDYDGNEPDITAPGIDILAAFSPVGSPSCNPEDNRSVKYSIMSGISVSCAHVAGAPAYVKTFHPDWSPSAIKSALMTTDWLMYATECKSRYIAGHEFADGSGHVNLVKAVDPGLVYEVAKADYIAMLCSMDITYFAKCPEHIQGSLKDLNYPSMTFFVISNTTFKIDFPRTVTNVGLSNSAYKAEITSTSQVKVTMEPSILSFNSLDEKKSFVVTAVGEAVPAESVASASQVWTDGTHNVWSPIAVFTYLEFDRN